jgi:hypothetical protein
VTKRRARRNRPKWLGRTASFKSIGNVGQHKMVSYRVGSWVLKQNWHREGLFVEQKNSHSTLSLFGFSHF